MVDIIIVDGDPLADIEAKGRAAVVVKGGEIAYYSGRKAHRED